MTTVVRGIDDCSRLKLPPFGQLPPPLPPPLPTAASNDKIDIESAGHDRIYARAERNGDCGVRGQRLDGSQGVFEFAWLFNDENCIDIFRWDAQLFQLISYILRNGHACECRRIERGAI